MVCDRSSNSTRVGPQCDPSVVTAFHDQVNVSVVTTIFSTGFTQDQDRPLVSGQHRRDPERVSLLGSRSEQHLLSKDRRIAGR